MQKTPVAVTFALLLTACTRSQKVELRDTEGRRFEAVCKPSGCTVTGNQAAQPTGEPPPKAQPAFEITLGSRVFGICDTWKPGTPQMLDCRPLTCETDSECPPAKGLAHGSCTNKLCIEPSGKVNSDDAVLLCLAGTGAPPAQPRHRERFAMASLCGEPCIVPKVCRQP